MPEESKAVLFPGLLLFKNVLALHTDGEVETSNEVSTLALLLGGAKAAQNRGHLYSRWEAESGHHATILTAIRQVS
jgi:hypothetical protein